MDKSVRRRLIIFLGLALVALIVLAVLFRNPLRTLASLRQVDDYPLYTMTYYGDYGFGALAGVGTPTAAGLRPARGQAGPSWACTCFAALGQADDPRLGRNFDWLNRASLLLFTDPDDGYASASMVDISYFGYDAEGPSWFDRGALLDAPYLPFDGMNEAGLAVGMMAVPHAEGGDDPGKTTIGSLQAIRLMLDYAADVDQAMTLLGQYNVDFGGGPPVHYLIADASGHSAVIELLEDERVVLRNEEPWQVSTNFILAEVQPQGADSPCWRYNKAYQALERTGGSASRDQAMAILADTSQSNGSHTMWSIVYTLSSGDIQVVMGRTYDQVRVFELEMIP